MTETIEDEVDVPTIRMSLRVPGLPHADFEMKFSADEGGIYKACCEFAEHTGFPADGLIQALTSGVEE